MTATIAAKTKLYKLIGLSNKEMTATIAVISLFDKNKPLDFNQIHMYVLPDYWKCRSGTTPSQG